MDPFNTAAAAIDLVQLTAEIGKRIFEYAQSVANADKAYITLQEKLKGIENSLKLGSDALRSVSNGDLCGPTQQLLSSLMSPGGALYDCNVMLTRLETELDISYKTPTPQTTRARLKWPLKENKLKDHHILLSITMDYCKPIFHGSVDDKGGMLRWYTILPGVSWSWFITNSTQPHLMALGKSKLLDWLSPLQSLEGKLDTAIQKRDSNTVKWFFVHKSYTDWTRREGSLLWLHGIPGSGKTILASTIIQKLQGLSGNARLAYFFCDFSDPSSKDPAVLMRTLTHQLVRRMSDQECTETFTEAFIRIRDGLPPPSHIHALHETLLVKAIGTQQVVIVIDALDECDSREGLLPILCELAKNPTLHLCVTSRYDRDIATAFTKFSTISLHDVTSLMGEDFRRYVSKAMHIQLDRLDACRTAKAFNDALNSLPKGLDATYERILDGVSQKDDMTLLQNVLKLLVSAHRPLPLSEIADAIIAEEDESTWESSDIWSASIEVSGESILKTCGALVHHNVRTDALTLSHYSVKVGDIHSDSHRQYLKCIGFYALEDEFLCEDGTDASWYGIDEEDDGTDASWCGIDEEDDGTDTSLYGLHEEDDVTLAEPNMANEGAERPSLARRSFKFTYTSGNDCITHPFVTYAFTHWLDHVREIEIARPELAQDVLTFLPDSRFNQIRSKCLLDFVSRHSLYYIPLSCGPIALLLRHGLVHTIRKLGDTHPHLLEELDSDISNYGSFLMLAVFSANLTMAESLLNLGVDCDKVTSKHHIAGDPISALWLAIEYGHDEMFTLLVRAGARLELPETHIDGYHSIVGLDNVCVHFEVLTNYQYKRIKIARGPCNISRAPQGSWSPGQVLNLDLSLSQGSKVARGFQKWRGWGCLVGHACTLEVYKHTMSSSQGIALLVFPRNRVVQNHSE
ncbi:predicted protein [Postia placenta Mad-698-R]|uniref:Nephrocystin 3-like N-terminal domain-containing protein n=1 Tax=Postia placenta MAD-698-R-SB12 TaxID=670580 RepID=A0A1X6MLY9_9APHY|nr:hypothetical protein POSPLADRAFT_1156975 [Postia placenta MAD-698-R-SB12]EED82826.1 predicted protein [Postia placenta Mad-698-R]OSX57390.1 hypothetical protein POSPLADRAFT_1156975 [Postia placenta MAD-698-R-SB12]